MKKGKKGNKTKKTKAEGMRDVQVLVQELGEQCGAKDFPGYYDALTESWSGTHYFGEKKSISRTENVFHSFRALRQGALLFMVGQELPGAKLTTMSVVEVGYYEYTQSRSKSPVKVKVPYVVVALRAQRGPLRFERSLPVKATSARSTRPMEVKLVQEQARSELLREYDTFKHGLALRVDTASSSAAAAAAVACPAGTAAGSSKRKAVSPATAAGASTKS